VSADEIFVLILVAGCAGALLTMELRSRRQRKMPAASAAPGISERVIASEAVVEDVEPPVRERRQGRRKR
jgi:hypothetical protein